MCEVGVEIVKTEEAEESGIKYLNINVSNSEVERNPDIVRLCADAGILEYVEIGDILIADQCECENCIHEEMCKWKEERHGQECAYMQEPKTGHWIMSNDGLYRPICDNCGAHPWKGYIPTVEEAKEVFKYCPNCGCRMVEPQESEDKE